MAVQRGRNGGVSGAVDILGTPKFWASILAFKQKLTTRAADRSGRGTGRWSKSRAFRPGGSLALTGEVIYKGYPLPTEWKGQEGTITLQFHTGATQTVTVRVDEAEISLVKDTEDTWKISLVCTILANPTLQGFGGTQPAATDPAKSDQELYAGLTKVYDPNNLQTAATRQYDCWPLGDTDSAERQKLADIVGIATANAFLGAKVKTAALAPGRSDEAGVITVTLALTDTVEDVTNPIHQETHDPDLIVTSATDAAVNGEPYNPNDDLVPCESTTQELHDAAFLKRTQYRLRTNKDAIEMDGSQQTLDPNKIDSAAQTTQVFDPAAAAPADPAAPSSELQIVGRTTQKINRKRSKRTTAFDVTDSRQKREYPQTQTQTDPQALEDWASLGQVFTNGSAPSDPSVPAGLKLHHKFDVPVTPTQTMRVWMWRKLDTADERTYPATQTTVDPSDLTSNGTSAVVYDNSSVPSDPAAPTGQRLVYARTHPATPTRSVRVYVFEKDSSAERLLQQHAATNTDPQGLRSEASRSALDGAPTGPGGAFVLRNQRSWNVTHDHIVSVYEYGLRSTLDDIEMPGSPIEDDASDLSDSQVITKVQASATPAPPSVPTGLVLRRTHTTQENANKYVHRFVYARRTEAEDTTLAGTVLRDDQSDLGDERTFTAFSTNDPTPPTQTYTGYALRNIDTVQVHAQGTGGTPGKWKHTLYFGRRTTAEDVTLPGTVLSADPQSLASTRTYTAFTTDDPTPPAAPTFTGYIVRDTETVQIHAQGSGGTPGKWRHTHRYGVRSTKDDVEMEGTLSRYESLTGGRRLTTTVIDSTDQDWSDGTAEGIAAATFNRLKGGVTFDWVEVLKLNASRARKSIHTIDDMQIVNSRAEGSKRATNGVLRGFAVAVWLSQKWRRSTGWWQATVTPQSLYQTTMTFGLKRRMVTLPVMPLGTCNASPFLGLPALSVSYAGQSLTYNRNIGLPRVLEITYWFRFDSLGIFDDTGIQAGTFLTDADLSGVSAPGYVDASLFGWPASIVAAADYSPFLA